MRFGRLLLGRLGTRALLGICATLFVVDLVMPDPLPFVDELFLGAATLLLARWQRRGREGD